MNAKSGYERLAQVDVFEDPLLPQMSNSRTGNFAKSVAIVAPPTQVHRLHPSGGQSFDPSSSTGVKTRHRSNSGIDIKAINARLERYYIPLTGQRLIVLDGSMNWVERLLVEGNQNHEMMKKKRLNIRCLWLLDIMVNFMNLGRWIIDLR